MSITLPTVNLASAIVGQKGSISLANAAISAHPTLLDNPPTIQIFNESGCGLQVIFPVSGNAYIVPAGSWPKYQIKPGESQINYTVLYTLPNPPVTSLYAIYYAPNEHVPDTPPLGNSPIGIGGTVNVSSVQTLSNEGGATGGLVIDMGDATFAQILTMRNNGACLWSVNQGGVKHQIANVETTGTPLQLGQFNDNVEVLGNLAVDQTTFLQVGSITGWSKFSANGTAGKNVVNHGLGLVPDFVILTPNLNSSPSAVALGYNAATLTSTTVDVWQNIAFSWIGLAIAF